MVSFDISKLYSILKVIFHNFGNWGSVEREKKFKFSKEKVIEIQVVLKFLEERMKITLILFVYVILSSKWSLKKHSPTELLTSAYTYLLGVL